MAAKPSRRAVLGGAIGATALAALPPSVQRALAAPPRPGTLSDIEHVVIFMQENRAFDHYFGTAPGVRGFGDRTAVRGINGQPVFRQPDPTRAEGFLAPFSMNAAHTNAYRQGAPDFSYTTSMGAWARGVADGYVTRRGGGWLGQGFYEPADMPFYAALASVFTVGDAYYCSMQTSTNPNREHFMTGTSGATVRDLAVFDNTEIPAGYEWKTYAERLEQAGVSWKTYQALDNFDDNALAWFKAFHDAKPGSSLYERGMRMAGDSSQQGDPFAMGDALVAEFAADVKADKLPQVSWLVAPAALSEHADYAPPNGEHLTAQLLSALADNPAVWAKTAFILNYDEHGGFFDHVLPPVPPLGNGRGKSSVSTDGELVVRVTSAEGGTAHRVVNQAGQYRVRAADGSLSWSSSLPAGETLVSGPHPLGLGMRVPLIIASPWTRGGAVDSTVYDHTSVIQFLERRFGVLETNISPWRRAVTGDLVSAFDFSGDEPRWPRLPDTSGNRKKSEDAAGRPAPTVPSPQVLVRQQAGTKRLRPLPYALTLKSTLRPGAVDLELDNGGDQAAVFAVYPEPGEPPKHYTVSRGTGMKDTWPISAAGFDLRVHGPSGALWHLRGRDVSLDASVETHGRVASAVVLNHTRKTRTFVVGDLAYGGGVREVRVPAGQSRTVPMPIAQHGWYDVAVTLVDDPSFLRRHAGRLPSPAEAVTDPALGVPDPLATWLTLPTTPSAAGQITIVPGRPTRLTAQLVATDAVTDLVGELRVPAGWRGHPTAGVPTKVAAGQAVTATWEITSPVDLTDKDTRLLQLRLHGRAARRMVVTEAASIPAVAAALTTSAKVETTSTTIDEEVIVPGAPTRLNVALTAADDLSGITAALVVPSGWASRLVTAAPRTLAAGKVATATWEVTAPAHLTNDDPRNLRATVRGSARGRVIEAKAESVPIVAPNMTGHLLDEDFESLVDRLQHAVDRPAPSDMLGWTTTPPAGWSIVNAPGMPQGTKELQGWSFMTKRMFGTGGQDRASFSRGLGILAVADPDDWDDTGNPSAKGAFDSTLISPAVPVPAGATKLYLVVDSHYRQEAPQKATLTATFDAGAPVQVVSYSGDSTGNDNAGKDVENAEIRKEIAVPAGATKVTLRFRVFDARNNWYWAVDHIRLDSGVID
ncbi:phosphocholine-specific phospholipase C [Luteipulveratus mongoliensis]|uniref:phosphocholine-specific phospholipase C n=1 Tax=Luteipulveratus mongoliensis TaxID=571913 RepID=UPI000697A403|nr:phospholipase C, phosphocholine-specific [Luteipulveratus mongoliensis]